MMNINYSSTEILIEDTFMAAKKTTRKTDSKRKQNRSLREPAEIRYSDQLEALRQNDTDPRPASWQLSPRAVLSYVLGGEDLKAKINRKNVRVPITRKFHGDRTMVERAIVTLAGERALFLVGDPGTGKSRLSEHLSAAANQNHGTHGSPFTGHLFRRQPACSG